MKKYLRSLLTISVIFTCFYGCKTELPKPEKTQNTSKLSPELQAIKEKAIDSLSKLKLTVHLPKNETVTLNYADKEGNILNTKQLKEIKSRNGILELCDENYVDDQTYKAIFKGVYYDYYGTSEPVQVHVLYEFDLPANVTPTGNVGYLRYSLGSTLVSRNSAPIYTLVSTFYDDVFPIQYNKYRVTYVISVPYTDFCSSNAFQSRIKMNSDCDLIPQISTVWSNEVDWEATTYYQPQFIYTTSISANTLTFMQINVLSTYCHYPYAYNSPKYIVEYKLSSSSTWIPLATPMTYDEVRSLTVSPGTYDTRYKVLLQANSAPTPDLYTEYINGYPATVY